MFAALLVAAIAASPQVTVRTLDGQSVSGELVSLTSGEVTVSHNDAKTSWPVGDILTLEPKQQGEPAEFTQPFAWVKLTDGSRLSTKTVSAGDEDFKLTLQSGQDVTVPRAKVESVLYRDQTAELAQQWKQIASVERSADIIVVRKNEALDYLEGVLGEISTEKVDFQLDGDTIPVKLEKVEGYFFFHAGGAAATRPLCVAELDTGTVMARAIAMEEDQFVITGTSGIELKVAAASLQRLDFSQGKIRFLGDLEPALVEWTPFFAPKEPSPELIAFFQPRSDQALGGGKLQLGGRSFEKGLAVHSRTQLVYVLPDQYSRFTGLVGIDDRQQGRGHLELVIEGDGKPLLNRTITGQDEPLSLDLDITGVRRLSILVDYGKDLDISDHLNFCDAKLIQ